MHPGFCEVFVVKWSIKLLFDRYAQLPPTACCYGSVLDYLIATAHSAGPGHGLHVCVADDMLQDNRNMLRRVAEPLRWTSWAMLGQYWGYRWITFGLLWCTLGDCWQCWGHLGIILGGLGGYLGPPLGYLGSCWDYVWAILGPLGASSST